ncbi:MAG TPA: SCP2 sterol-binding domain-containing protein [Polyangiaceae bacterium]|nr:SCP2 sterol-binding domain-containing protein [Polyangiaceae bacterium]
MPIDSARSFFDLVKARGNEPRLQHLVGTWEFDIDGEGKWFASVDHGALDVRRDAPEVAPRSKLRVSRDDFLRVVRGDDHENLITASMRGLICFEGDIAFTQALGAFIPFEAEEVREARKAAAKAKKSGANKGRGANKGSERRSS